MVAKKKHKWEKLASGDHRRAGYLLQRRHPSPFDRNAKGWDVLTEVGIDRGTGEISYMTLRNVATLSGAKAYVDQRIKTAAERAASSYMTTAYSGRPVGGILRSGKRCVLSSEEREAELRKEDERDRLPARAGRARGHVAGNPPGGARRKAYKTDDLPGITVKWSPVNQAYFVTWQDQVLRVISKPADVEDYLRELRQGRLADLWLVGGLPESTTGNPPPSTWASLNGGKPKKKPRKAVTKKATKKPKKDQVCASSGYACQLKGDAAKWRTISDERWDTVVIDGGPVTLLGKRRIDGTEMCVFKKGSKVYAQSCLHVSKC